MYLFDFAIEAHWVGHIRSRDFERAPITSTTQPTEVHLPSSLTAPHNSEGRPIQKSGSSIWRPSLRIEITWAVDSGEWISFWPVKTIDTTVTVLAFRAHQTNETQSKHITTQPLKTFALLTVGICPCAKKKTTARCISLDTSEQ